jgi:hypothetical protein
LALGAATVGCFLSGVGHLRRGGSPDFENGNCLARRQKVVGEVEAVCQGALVMSCLISVNCRYAEKLNRVDLDLHVRSRLSMARCVWRRAVKLHMMPTAIGVSFTRPLSYSTLPSVSRIGRFGLTLGHALARQRRHRPRLT